LIYDSAQIAAVDRFLELENIRVLLSPECVVRQRKDIMFVVMISLLSLLKLFKAVNNERTEVYAPAYLTQDHDISD
jgi:hypothetical protein